MAPYVIGFDVGGTRLKCGAVTEEGEVRMARVLPSGYTMEPRALLEALEAEVERIGGASGGAPHGIGLGFSGAVDPGVGVVYLPGKFKGLEGFPVVPRLADATGVPVVADNDGRQSIQAEARYGPARGRKWAVTITLGTGVGSGVLLDGKVLRDPHLQFGTQMSHIVMQAQGGRLCITGARGTAEMMCSATALAMAVRDGLARGIPSSLSEAYFADPHSVDFEAVIRAVEGGDPLSCDELKYWTNNVGWLLVSAVHVYAPEVIILSGGATNAAAHFLPALQAHVNEHTFRYPPGEPVPILLSALRDHAGVLGAAALAWQHLADA
jgi:glucokinase